jgi:hypothetical protein
MDDSRSRALSGLETPEVRLDVCDLTALVFEEQRRASRVLDDLRTMRQAVCDLAVLDRLDQRWDLSLPLRTASVRVRAGLLPLGNSHVYFSSL